MHLKNLKEIIPVVLIFTGSVLLTFFMHTSGIFGFLEMKLYDFRFSLRGAISGTPLYSKTKLPSEEYFVDNNNNNKYDKDIDTFNLEGYGCWDVEQCATKCDDEKAAYIFQPKNLRLVIGAACIDQ